MKKLLQRVALAVTAIATLSVVSFAPVYAASTTRAVVCDGAAIAGADCNDGGKGLNDVVAKVINILSVIIGFAAVIMIMLAGFRYITASGDASGVKAAKDSLLYAIIGLIVVAMAQTIVRFVLHAV